MKEKKEKKLQLGKVTVQDLTASLERDEQKAVKGGSLCSNTGTTEMVIFC